MTCNVHELKIKIKQKNLLLSSIGRDENAGEGEALKIQCELDRLLYQYYKLIVNN
ncbi:hypothetical protein DFR58_10732 [Anaerobacterium chartisolvens]|uniref:Spo0E like sporulation regulatory protein n=1 Tax=Anaerobacterium chartisolvens TaxID=1297424 RepID=A0A369B7I3_9FIRM|nr:hypothetical protein [Anaerobacterium chartisolvens]RCX17489.1 hypothetical protein DFR58_10732 [Anaerobacterium chartisolvens]